MTIWSNQMLQRFDHPPAVERTGKRPAPILLTVLRTDQPVPGGAMDNAHNRPPLSGFTLYPRVGKIINEVFTVTPGIGSVDKSTVTTDSNGQVELVFTASAGLAEGEVAHIAFLDRMNRVAPVNNGETMAPFFASTYVYTESTTNSESQSAFALYSDGHIKYKNYSENARASFALAAAVAGWNVVRDQNGKRRFVFEPVADPTTSARRGISVKATYPAVVGAVRDSWAFTTEPNTRDVAREIMFCLENIDPDPTYRVPSQNDPAVNRRRSFARKPSAAQINLTGLHELAHVLGVGHHDKLGGQQSCMCVGRNGTSFEEEDGEFPFWVSGVLKQSRQDELTAFLSFPTAFD